MLHKTLAQTPFDYTPRDTQKDEYDDAWLAWMFYVNLTTVHLVLGRVHGVRTFPGDGALSTAPKPSGKLVL